MERLSVQIETDDDSRTKPPERITKRMAASVNTVGEHVLIGRQVSEINSNKAAYERIIKEVFDRILVGYSIDRVTIEPNVETKIILTVTPWGEVVREVELQTDFGVIAPGVAELIRQDMGDIEEQVNNVLIGLPIDAVDWAGGVSKSIVREMLADKLPEFRPSIEIISGSKTVIKLTLLPIGQTIEDTRVVLKSGTIPNVLLLTARPKVDNVAKAMTGLPVNFVHRHSKYFLAELSAAAARDNLVQQYGLAVVPNINVGAHTDIIINADTDKFKVTLEGFLDMGRREDDTFARLHAGKYMSDRDEGFVELDFIPSSISWKFKLGWGHDLNSDTAAGFKYGLEESEYTMWLNHAADKNWSIRLERTPERNYNEMGIRYRLHEFLSAEYVVTTKDNWLRLIGNL